MPVLCSRFLQPQLVPLLDVIKGLVPVPNQLILICGASISLSLTIILCSILKRKHGRRFRRLAGNALRPWGEVMEDQRPLREKADHRMTSSSKVVDFKQSDNASDKKDERTITTMSDAPQNENLDLQRRRSYTSKGAADEMSGEIIVAAEGWRKHTRVFGTEGGVCQACLESEERMKAMNLSLQNRLPQEAEPSRGKPPPAEKSSQEPSR